MRMFFVVAIAIVTVNAAPAAFGAEPLSDVDRGVDKADRTMQNAEDVEDRSRNLLDRVKGWFKRHNKNVGADPQVGEVQQQLAALGFDPGPADGIIGPKTLDAVTRFQQSRGLPVEPRITPQLVQALRSTAPAAAAPTAALAPAGHSEPDILLALQYATGADAHHLRCAGIRDPNYRDEFLGILSPGQTARYAQVYEDELAKQYGTVTTCQPEVAEWLAGMHRQKMAALGPATGGTAQPVNLNEPAFGITTASGSAPPPTTAQTGAATGGPPLSNPEAGLSGNLALNTTGTAVPATGTAALDRTLVGYWAWIHPRQGIIAFLDVTGDSGYQLKSAGNQETGGRVETESDMLRFVAGTGETSEYSYQPVGPDEINLVDTAGEQTVLLRNTVE